MAERNALPLTLTLVRRPSRDPCRRRRPARAKASLASTRSRSPPSQPAFFSAALRSPGWVPVSHDPGSTPACAHDTMRSAWSPVSRLRSPSSALSAAGTVIDARRVGGGDGAFLVEAGAACRPFRAWCRAWDIRRVSDHDVALLRVLIVTGVILSLNLPAFNRPRPCSARRPRIHPAVTCDLPLPATFSAVLPM